MGILFLIIQLIMAGFFLFLCLAFVTGGPFVPSSKTSVMAMVKLANLRSGQTVFDVGSGDGRVLMAAARQGAKAVGIEINPYLVWYTRFRALWRPYKGKVTVLWQNLWTTDLSRADVVFVYLIPWKMADLAAKLKKELKPGALVISNSFIFPGWKVVRKDTDHHVYAFVI
ncbi:50S ribosomal protein L11 methyltransferase [Patescibacteria group bacterium]|nr:50S ribosomal protein L11 methyltransferase [Patescibacteria group bacterium]